MVFNLSSSFFSKNIQHTDIEHIKHSIPTISLNTLPIPAQSAGEISSLEGRIQPIQIKNLLKTLVEQVKKNPKHVKELLESLEKKQLDFQNDRNAFQEVIELLKVDHKEAETRIHTIDAHEKETLGDYVFVEHTITPQEPPAKYKKSWISYAANTGKIVWQVTRISSTALYVVSNIVILNSRVIQIAAVASSVASIVGIVYNPYLPVLKTVAAYLLLNQAYPLIKMT